MPRPAPASSDRPRWVSVRCPCALRREIAGTLRGPCPLFYILRKSPLWQICRNWRWDLILGATGIDVFIPQQDSAGHAFDVGEAVLSQKLGKLHGPATGSAMTHDLVVLMLL